MNTMNTIKNDPAIDELISNVVNIGSAYDIDGMDELYTADQSILFLDGDSVLRVPRAAMLAEFTSRRNAGEPKLSTEHRVLHVEQQGDNATAVLYRRMSQLAQPAMYELRLRKEAGKWMVAGETVTPWPSFDPDSSFLPPRKSVA